VSRAPNDFDQPNTVYFRERRGVPWWWWVVGLALALPTSEAVVVLGPEMTLHHTSLYTTATLVATALFVAACLILLSRSIVSVDADGLHAGRDTLVVRSVGRARGLDAAAARRLLGPGLRADAQLSLIPWIKTAIQVEVDDPDDSTPYWVVATRRPAQLLAALGAVRGTPTGHPADDNGPRLADEMIEHTTDRRGPA
jgi:hypothetical protein